MGITTGSTILDAALGYLLLGGIVFSGAGLLLAAALAAREMLRGTSDAVVGQRAMNDKRWIPVEQRLPSRDQVVLAYTPGDTYCGRHVYEALFVSMNEWCTDRGDEECVTHWMPLPEPPEVK